MNLQKRVDGYDLWRVLRIYGVEGKPFEALSEKFNQESKAVM